MQSTRAALPTFGVSPRAAAPIEAATLRRRVPLSHRPSRVRDEIGRWAAVGSIAAHVLVLSMLVVFYDDMIPPRAAPVAPAGPAERVDYLDLEFPAAGAPLATLPATVPAAGSTAAPTSARTHAEEALGRFPMTAPAGIPAPSVGGRAPAGPAGAARPGRSVAEALGTGYKDERLIVNPRALRVEVEKSQHQRYMEHLQARVDAINDSIYGEAARAKAATDWTRTDKEGRRWGVSPEGLHLGGLTVPRELLPVPSATGDNASLQEQRDRVRAREEIQRQEDDRARRKAREDAIRATRERKGAAKKKAGA